MHFGFHVICLWNSGREQKSHMFPSTIVKQQQLDALLILEGWKKSDKMVNGRVKHQQTLLRMLLVLLLKAVLRGDTESFQSSALWQWKQKWVTMFDSLNGLSRMLCFGALLRTDKRDFVKVVMHGLVEHGSESCADLMLGCCSYDVHCTDRAIWWIRVEEENILETMGTHIHTAITVIWIFSGKDRNQLRELAWCISQGWDWRVVFHGNSHALITKITCTASVHCLKCRFKSVVALHCPFCT